MKKIFLILSAALLMMTVFAGCSSSNVPSSGTRENETLHSIVLTDEIIKLTDGFSAVRYSGDYGFDLFLDQGGASSDSEVVSFLTDNVMSDLGSMIFGGNPFGCSTLTVKNAAGNSLFGRNFDWSTCNAMVIQSQPENGYSSISTVNKDFISMNGISLSRLPDELQALAGLYAPLDGLNEMGLAVSVNMIEDSDTIEQNTDKPDITTTTAIRLLLDKAANVEEAIQLLNSHDMHASFGYMVHFAIADRAGNSVVVEYVNNEMIVTETPAVTNFYLAYGEKNGIGTRESHKRYEILMNRLKDYDTMEMNDVRDALDSVSKDNFGGFASTEWSIVMNQSTGEVWYYHRENYTKPYVFTVTGGQES